MNKSQIAFLVFLLVLLPFCSWFFLNNGSIFFKQNYVELDPKGIIPADIAEYELSSGEKIWDQKDSLYLLLIGLAYPGDSLTNLIQFEKLCSDFQSSFIEERNGVRSPLKIKSLVDSTLFDSFITIDLADSISQDFVSSNVLRGVANSLGVIGPDAKTRNFIVLVDKVGRVRQQYLDFSVETLKRLYRHLSILIPPEARKDYIFKPSKEL